MRPRTGLSLLLAGAIVLAGGWYFGPAQEPGAAQSVEAGRLMFPGLANRLQDAAEVDIAHQGKTLVIRRHGDVWGLADRGGYPVEAEKLRGMLTALTELRLVEPRTADPAAYAKLGLQDPNAPDSTADLLRVLDAAGKPIAELIVGHRRVLTAGNVPGRGVRPPPRRSAGLAGGRQPGGRCRSVAVVAARYHQHRSCPDRARLGAARRMRRWPSTARTASWR